MKTEKNIFISHSSADTAFAAHLCSVFEEEEGLGCWIAPRDIPYGSEWAGEITEAIRNSAVMIFIFTKNSNRSSQVVREINTALRNNVTIIPIKLGETEMNASLNYYLSNLHWLVMEDVRGDEKIRHLARRVKNYILGIDEAAEYDEDPLECEVDISGEDWEKLINLDDELDAKFEELFDKVDEDEVEETLSPFRKKLLDRIAERVVENFFVTEDEEENMEEEAERADEKPDAEEEAESEDEEPENGDEDEDWAGSGEADEDEKYFTLTETEEADTLIFMVRKKITEPEYQRFFAAEPVRDELEIFDDGTRRRTYYLKRRDKEGNPIILLTFMHEQNVVVINMGFCIGDIIKIGKKPMTMRMTAIENKESQVKVFRANEEGKYVIDPETCKLVPRKSYYDKKKRRRFYYMKIQPYKKYFAFAFDSEKKREDGGDKTAEEMRASAFDIAYGYYAGRYGLKQNMLNAAEWFEKAGTPEAYYYLGLIFRNDPFLADAEDAAYYMKLAFEGGEERAEKYLN